MFSVGACQLQCAVHNIHAGQQGEDPEKVLQFVGKYLAYLICLRNFLELSLCVWILAVHIWMVLLGKL